MTGEAAEGWLVHGPWTNDCTDLVVVTHQPCGVDVIESEDPVTIGDLMAAMETHQCP